MSRTVHLVNHFYGLGYFFLRSILLYQSVKAPLVWLYLCNGQSFVIGSQLTNNPSDTSIFHICCRWNHPGIGGLALALKEGTWTNVQRLHSLCVNGNNAKVSVRDEIKKSQTEPSVCWLAVIFGKSEDYSHLCCFYYTLTRYEWFTWNSGLLVLSIFNAFYQRQFKSDWLIFYCKLVIGPQPHLIYNSFQNNGVILRISFHCSTPYSSHRNSTPLILVSKMPSWLVLPKSLLYLHRIV